MSDATTLISLAGALPCCAVIEIKRSLYLLPANEGAPAKQNPPGTVWYGSVCPEVCVSLGETFEIPLQK